MRTPDAAPEPNKTEKDETRMDINNIAAQIDPSKAQLAIARLCVALGREFDWNSDTFNDIAAAVRPAVPEGLPPIMGQDEDDEAAFAFWRNVTG